MGEKQPLLTTHHEPVTPRSTRWRRARARCALVAVLTCVFAFTKFVADYGGEGADEGWVAASAPVDTEKLFLSIPDPLVALNVSREYATHPHVAGSHGDFADAQTMLALFQSEFGIAPPPDLPIFPAGSPASRNATLHITSPSASAKAWIDIYYPLLNTPLSRNLSILSADGDPIWNADLLEDGDPLDEDAARYRDAVPPFHGLSKDGDVTGKLIFANYGTREDYARLGSALEGKIALVRYGGIYRGIKVQGAEDHGAIGILMYTDPRDDGTVTVANGYAAFPHGPARNPSSVQRGSVQYISTYPGDPLTPGTPAYPPPGFNESARDEAFDNLPTEGGNVPRIPSLPISWTNAERLLEELGLGEDDEWLGPDGRGRVSERDVRLINRVDTKITPIWNVMATIPGRIKDEVVVIGCHRDAWVLGAADPTSGTVSLHEIIRAFGALLKTGWQPTRTILFASWDAEEYTLVGSTEWGEDFPEWIQDHAVAYLNVDVSTSGSRWTASASPSLAHIIRKTAEDIPHPTNASRTLWDAKEDSGPFKGPSSFSPLTGMADALMGAPNHGDSGASATGVSALGSGSDFTVFLQRLGVASTDQGFEQTESDAVYHYHSIYDSQRWQEMYADPGFHRHVAIAKHLGLLTLRIADAVVLPLNTTQYAIELDWYVDKVEDIAKNLTLSPDFTLLRGAIGRLQNASFALDAEKHAAEIALKSFSFEHGRCQHQRFKTIRKWIKRVFGVRSPPRDVSEEYLQATQRVNRVNKKLVAFERGFISEEGLDDREWYKHLGVAPGRWLGYGATTLPAITEALTLENNVSLAENEAARLASLLDKLAVVLAA
ncbi:hypothetical protein PLICRDRAFT_169670 [Plicaturopsis crispa FD-325 SS-3]|nr:hypothetical protein PLICRDRAFT_169670 [Plicaturopsis crispa FD-325 SS-3]